MSPTPANDPLDLVASLSPARETLVALRAGAKPFGVEYDAADAAIRALDRVGEKIGGRPAFFTRPRAIPVIGEIGDGGVVTFYPGGRELLDAALTMQGAGPADA